MVQDNVHTSVPRNTISSSHHTPSIITPSPEASGQHHCMGSVISLSSIDEDPVVCRPSTSHQHHRAGSVISLSSTDEDPVVPGPSAPHQHRHAESVISLSSGSSDEDPIKQEPVKQERLSSSPIIQRRSQSMVDGRGESYSDAIDLDAIHVWPYDFPACDIKVGFQKCQQASHTHGKVRVSTVFQKHFGTKFMKTTFYDHHHFWMGVSPVVHEHYIGYGHSPEGLWSKFLEKEVHGRGCE